MNSRRKFLRNGSLAASAILTAKPFKLLAEVTSPFYKNVNSIALLHTSHSSVSELVKTVAAVSSLKDRDKNIILLNAGGANHAKSGYDNVSAEEKDVDNFKIINKGHIRIGIIESVTSTSEVNGLAKMLKSEKGCNLVVCISSLGFKNRNNKDDLNLAKDSLNVDVIISGNNSTLVPSTVVLNNRGEEVLIDNAGNQHTSVGKIEIGFDAEGKTNQISFGAQTFTDIPLSLSLS